MSRWSCFDTLCLVYRRRRLSRPSSAVPGPSRRFNLGPDLSQKPRTVGLGWFAPLLFATAGAGNQPLKLSLTCGRTSISSRQIDSIELETKDHTMNKDVS